MPSRNLEYMQRLILKFQGILQYTVKVFENILIKFWNNFYGFKIVPSSY